MKKVLLFACVVFAAISASAQKLMPAEKSLVFIKQPVKVTNILANPDIQVKKMTAITANMDKAPAKADIYGSYIEDALSTDGELHTCSEATLSAANVQVEDGNVYDIQLVIDNGVISIYGKYDPATGVVNCGAQLSDGGGDATGYHFKVYGIVDGKLSEELSFTIDDDKAISCDQDGYIMYISDEGEYNGYTWDGPHFDPMFYPVNGVQAGFTNGISTGNQWVEYENSISVEDWGASVTIYNFCGMGALSIDINDDGTVSVPCGQAVYDLGFNEETQAEEIATYGKYFCFHGVDVDESTGNISTNTNKENVVGIISGNTITLTEYFRICSLFDSEGSCYAHNWYADGTTFTLNDGNYSNAAGVEEITETREDKIKNTKTYNVMGQQVNRATAKGLLIRDGKKFFKK